MLIGTKETFGVEYTLDANSGGEWMYGKICYWIGGHQVGDYELGTSLRDVLFQLRYLVYDSGNREDFNLCTLAHDYIFYRIDDAIYGREEHSDTDILDMPARFNITIPVDVFDQWKIFLVDCGNSSKIVFKRIEDSQVYLSKIPKGYFDCVIGKFYSDLESLLEVGLID